MMLRCRKCHAGLTLTDGAILWLCPVCGEYGTPRKKPPQPPPAKLAIP
jgi:predicted RNA-binding Zn-ribbon protein involved in translation (DUF1610 family)